MEITLLEDTDEELEHFWELRLRALRDAPEAFGGSYETYSHTPLSELIEKQRNRMSPESVIFIAKVDEKFVGMCGLRREESLKLRHKASIWGMYVSPEHRGKRIGHSLITHAINFTDRLSGVEQLALSVVSSNVAARNLYESMGFEVWGTEKHALKIGDAYYDEDWMVLFVGGN